jgi:hypothetical protein
MEFSNREELIAFLEKLSPSDFEGVLFHLKAPPTFFLSESVPLRKKIIDFLDWLESDEGPGTDELFAILEMNSDVVSLSPPGSTDEDADCAPDVVITDDNPDVGLGLDLDWGFDVNLYNFDVDLYNLNELPDLFEDFASINRSLLDEGQFIEEENPCYIYAEMDERIIVQRVTTLEVIVSGDEIEFQSGPTAQSGKISVNSENPLIIQAIPKTNFTVVGEDRIEIDPPASKSICRIYFDLRPTDLGEGEVWIIIRQSQMPLLTLIIKPYIVENRAQTQVSPPLAMVSQQLMDTQNSSLPNKKIYAQSSIAEYPLSNEPLHQLRIIELRNGDRITYRYDFDSPSLGILTSFDSDPIYGDRQEFVNHLYEEIESRWLSTSDDVKEFTEELRAFGGSLFEQLFPNGLQELLWTHRSQIDSIMVLSTEPFIPWELIHLKEPSQNYLPDETLFLGQMGLVRWLFESGRFPPENILIREGKVRYVIPRYPCSSYKLPQAEKECEFLVKTFRACQVTPKSADVRRVLKNCDFDLLHFAGHGISEHNNIGNSKLLMEGRMEKTRYIKDYLSATVVEQNSRLSDGRPMVILNACQVGREGYSLTGIGGFAEAFLKGGAGAFVGPLWSVGDRPARVFTETLYLKLLQGKPLSEASTEARKQAKKAGDATWLAYAVYGHPNMKIRFTRNSYGTSRSLLDR